MSFVKHIYHSRHTYHIYDISFATHTYHVLSANIGETECECRNTRHVRHLNYMQHTHHTPNISHTTHTYHMLSAHLREYCLLGDTQCGHTPPTKRRSHYTPSVMMPDGGVCPQWCSCRRPCVLRAGADFAALLRQGESGPAAAIPTAAATPMENPYCSCNLYGESLLQL